MNMFSQQPFTIIKLGGSLFDLPDLRERLLQFLDRNQFESPLIIPGGGSFADAVRTLDQQHHLGNALSHELGIRTLGISSRFVAGLSENFELIKPSEFDVPRSQTGKYFIADVSDFVLEYCPLRNSWDVTSDSIAAWLTTLHPASQLILLKSIPLPVELSLSSASKSNYVDAEFAQAASEISRICWCHFRSEEQELVIWGDNSINFQVS